MLSGRRHSSRIWLAAILDCPSLSTLSAPFPCLHPRWFTTTPIVRQRTAHEARPKVNRADLKRHFPPPRLPQYVETPSASLPDSTAAPISKGEPSNGSLSENVAFFPPWAHRNIVVKYKKQLASQAHMFRGRKSYDWNIPLSKLLSSTRAEFRPPRDGLERVIYLPEEVVHSLSGDIQENIWVHHVGTGCTVHVLHPSHSQGLSRQVVLRGSERAIELTEIYLNSLTSKETSEGASKLKSASSGAMSNDSTGGSTKIRHEWTMPKRSLDPRDQVRADRIPRPKSWSIRALADYIEQVVTAPLTKSMHRQLYRDDERHVEVVQKLLQDLLWDPDLLPFMSCRALDLALKFFCDQHMISTARSLFVVLEEEHLPLLTKTFNILLRGAAMERDLFHYTFILDIMLRRNIRPDAETWILLVKCNISLVAKRTIVSNMHELNLITDWNIRSVGPEVVYEEFVDHLVSGKKFQLFPQYMDSFLGSTWTSTATVNQMLDVVAELGQWDVTDEIMAFARGRGLQVRSRTFTQLLKIRAFQSNVEGTVDILLFMVGSRPYIYPNEFALPTAFTTAWHQHFYNVCRVLWRWSCMNGVVVQNMQHLMRRTLASDLGSDGLEEYSWNYRAGKVVIGVDSGSVQAAGGESRQSLLAASDLVNPAEGLAAKPTGGSTVEQRELLAHQLIARDLAAPMNYRQLRLEVWGELLRRAYAMDLVWQANDVARNQSLDWMIGNAIDIRLQRKVSPLVGLGAASAALMNNSGDEKPLETLQEVTATEKMETETSSPRVSLPRRPARWTRPRSGG